MHLTDKISFFHGDNLEGMKATPSGYYELGIVDPPYGINATDMSMGQNLSRADGWKREESTALKIKKKGWLNSGGGKLKNRILNTSDCNWDNEVPPQEYWDELFRITKNQIIFGGNYFNLPPTRCIVCWDKMQPWENFSQWEMAWTSFDKPAAMVRISNTGGANAEKKIHPTQKPVKLYRWLLNKFAKPGDKILDTHGGSLSIGIACEEMGFELTAYEKDEMHYNDAVKRFQLWNKLYNSQTKINFKL